MKIFLRAVLGLFFCVPFLTAETIESVSFNPARLGRYETLKVADRLSTEADLINQALTIQSGGTVTMQSASTPYTLPNVRLLRGTSWLMEDTDFQTRLFGITGVATFAKPRSSSTLSRINNITTSATEIETNYLNASELQIAETASFSLGGVRVSPPSSSGLSQCKSLVWVTRTTDEKKSVQVLGFDSCKGPDKCEKTYGKWQEVTANMVTDTCNGNTSIAYTCSRVTSARLCNDVARSTTLKKGTPEKLTAQPRASADTCDGNIYTKASSPSKACTDIYVDTTGSSIGGQIPLSMCAGFRPSGGDDLDQGSGLCRSLSDEDKQKLVQAGVSNGCLEYVIKKESYARFKNGCRLSLKFSGQGPYSIFYPYAHNNKWCFQFVTCRGTFYKVNWTLGFRQRSVVCCP